MRYFIVKVDEELHPIKILDPNTPINTLQEAESWIHYMTFERDRAWYVIVTEDEAEIIKIMNT